VNEPVDECGQCGADLYLNVEHECAVGGNIVVVWGDEEGDLDG